MVWDIFPYETFDVGLYIIMGHFQYPISFSYFQRAKRTNINVLIK